MSKDVSIAGIIVLACLGLVITALFLPKKETKVNSEKQFPCNLSVMQASNMFVITDHKNNVIYTIVINTDTKEIKTTVGETFK
jgi:hypothetical protein